MEDKINNSPSWDAALLAMSLGGRMRRISWDWDNRFVFSSDPSRYPFAMKLKMCYSSQCSPEDWEKWEPTKEDKSANDWVPSMEDKKGSDDLLSKADKKYKRLKEEKGNRIFGSRYNWIWFSLAAIILWILFLIQIWDD